jgi:hypothetical protein
MLAYAASRSFSERARQSWRTLSYTGIAIPFLSNIHASSAILVATASVFVFPSIWDLVKSQRERNGDKLPSLTSYQGALRERREFGAVPFSGLSGKWIAEIAFEDTISDAAYCSNEYGRRLSVICVRIPGLPLAKLDLVVNLLRLHTRSNDEVEIVSNGEFMVCSHLLRDALAADVILKRLEGALRSADLFSASLEVQLGKAVYPMHGYTGADLISYARSQLQPIATRA